jgi:tetratricopeptide (TPR) repeat protein
MPVTNACPSEEILRYFALGQLSPAEVERVAQHVERCDACLAFLHQASTQDAVVEVMNHAGTAVPLPDDPLKEMLRNWREQFELGRDVSADELCRDCPDLLSILEREIAKLKSDLAPAIEDTLQTSPRSQSGEPSPSFTGSRYRPLRFHAAGALGEVFLAHDEELGRQVALKRIKGWAAGRDDCRDRFVAEAEIAGRLEHPGIVPVYGMGTDASGQPFYAMRFIQGASLSDPIKAYHAGGAVSPSELRDLLQRLVAVSNAVAYAHSRGVIHRDLKPANVMLGKFGETLVVDWGLAKVVGRQKDHIISDEDTLLPHSRDEASRTIAGRAMGTPAYMSPEQASGLWDEVGPASDIFSLGAMLYHMLTGRTPYRGPQALESARLARYEPPRHLDRRISPALEGVCLKALAAAPAERYATALELAKDLEHWLADEPVSCYRDPLSTRLGRLARRRRTLLTSGGVAMLLVVVGGVAGLFLHQRAEYERERQLSEHRLQITTAALADLNLALIEAQRGRFAGAEQILAKAAGTLRGEPELADIRAQIEAPRDRLGRLYAFYRALGQAEAVAAQVSDMKYSPSDDAVIASSEAALKGLGIVPGAAQWWDRLPVEELLPRQREQLREDAVVALSLLALWRVKQGAMKFDSLFALPFKRTISPDAKTAYVSARENLRLVQAYCTAIHNRRSAAADSMDYFCRWRLGESLPQQPLRLDPVNSTEAYFLGIAHCFLDGGKLLPLGSWVRTTIAPEFLRLTALDFDTPLHTAERLLRSAADLDPEHYWAHFWLGQCLIARKEYLQAAQACNTCVALRPDYACGYVWRGTALVLEARRLQEQAGRDGLPSVLDRPEWWLGLVAKPPLHLADALLHVSLFAASHTQRQRTLDANRSRADLLARNLKGLDEGLKRLPDEAAIRFYRAVCLAEMGHWKEAVVDYTLCSELVACQRQVGLAPVEGLVGLNAGVRDHAGGLSGRDPKNPSLQAFLALACLGVGKNAEAARAAAACLAKEPRNGPALAVRGVLLLGQQKIAEALADLEAVPAKSPGETLATFAKAQAYEKAGDWGKAQQQYDRLLKGTGPVERSGAVAGWLQLEAHLGRARAARALDQFDDARRALADARAIDPQAAQRLESALLGEQP